MNQRDFGKKYIGVYSEMVNEVRTQAYASQIASENWKDDWWASNGGAYNQLSNAMRTICKAKEHVP